MKNKEKSMQEKINRLQDNNDELSRKLALKKKK